MNAAWDRSEEYYDPALSEDILGRTKNPPGIVGRTSQRPSGPEIRDIVTRVGIWFHSLSLPAFVVAMASSIAGVKICAKDVGRARLGRRLALLGPMGCGALAHIIQLLERPGEVGAAWRGHFLPHQEGALCSYRGSVV